MTRMKIKKVVAINRGFNLILIGRQKNHLTGRIFYLKWKAVVMKLNEENT